MIIKERLAAIKVRRASAPILSHNVIMDTDPDYPERALVSLQANCQWDERVAVADYLLHLEQDMDWAMQHIERLTQERNEAQKEVQEQVNRVNHYCGQRNALEQQVKEAASKAFIIQSEKFNPERVLAMMSATILSANHEIKCCHEIMDTVRKDCSTFLGTPENEGLTIDLPRRVIDRAKTSKSAEKALDRFHEALVKAYSNAYNKPVENFEQALADLGSDAKLWIQHCRGKLGDHPASDTALFQNMKRTAEKFGRELDAIYRSAARARMKLAGGEWLIPDWNVNEPAIPGNEVALAFQEYYNKLTTMQFASAELKGVLDALRSECDKARIPTHLNGCELSQCGRVNQMRLEFTELQAKHQTLADSFLKLVTEHTRLQKERDAAISLNKDNDAVLALIHMHCEAVNVDWQNNGVQMDASGRVFRMRERLEKLEAAVEQHLVELEKAKQAALSSQPLTQEYHKALLEFLNVIHRDGGAYTDTHGIIKSLTEAQEVVQKGFKAAQDLEKLRLHLKLIAQGAMPK